MQAVPDSEVWGVTTWSTLDFYNLPSSPAVLYPPVANDSTYTLFLTVVCPSGINSSVANVQNWYYPNSVNMFGIYDASNKNLQFYERNASDLTYVSSKCQAYSAFYYEDGSYYVKPSSTSYWSREYTYCSPAVAGSLPFPVFSTVADAEHYVNTGEVLNTYVSGTVPVEVVGFNEEVAGLGADAVSDTFNLPVSGEAAAENIVSLSDAYANGTAADIADVITAGGLAVDVPAGDVSLGDILDSVVALPGSIADALSDLLTVDIADEEVESELSVPAMITEKFPFCIPFDLIYLVEALAAEPEVPRFEIPIRIDYLFIHYDETFIVDFAEWQEVVDILHYMLDFLFCVILITSTRGLIKG